MSPAQTLSDVEVASDEDIAAGLARALERLGITLDELRGQAQRDEFSSEQARLTWSVISPIVKAA
jgi:hypothetical protein